MRKKNIASKDGFRRDDPTLTAVEEMEYYRAAHPGSPAAVRQPRLFIRGQLWIALLGPSVEQGIVGIGPTIEAALRAFDVEYLAGLRPHARELKNGRLSRASKLTVA